MYPHIAFMAGTATVLVDQDKGFVALQIAASDQPRDHVPPYNVKVLWNGGIDPVYDGLFAKAQAGHEIIDCLPIERKR